MINIVLPSDGINLNLSNIFSLKYNNRLIQTEFLYNDCFKIAVEINFRSICINK